MKYTHGENDYAAEDGNVIFLRLKGPCIICGDLTNFVEVNFEARICSEECCDKIWNEYGAMENRCIVRDIATALSESGIVPL